jgi:hypothetical protein
LSNSPSDIPCPGYISPKAMDMWAFRVD